MESFTQAYSSWNNNYSSPLHTKERIECFSKILVYLSGKFYPLCAPHKQNLNEIDLCASRNFYSCYEFQKTDQGQGRAGQGHGGHTVSSTKPRCPRWPRWLRWPRWPILLPFTTPNGGFPYGHRSYGEGRKFYSLVRPFLDLSI